MAKTGANRSAIDLETATRLARIRKLAKKLGPSEAARQTGTTAATASRILNGKQHKRSYTALDQLGLRFSDKLCRSCGHKAVIMCKSLRCIVCELRELAKEGVVTILPIGE